MADMKELFEKHLHLMGVRMPLGKGVASGVASDVPRGDASLLKLAEAYVPFGENGINAAAGINADGTLNFASWFTEYLRRRGVQRTDGVAFPCCISTDGFDVSSLTATNKKNADLLPSPGLVEKLRLNVHAKSVEFWVGFYGLCVKNSNASAENDWAFRGDTTIIVSFPKSGKESDESIVTKFLRFALSMNNFSFHNISEVSVQFSDQNAAKAFVANKLKPIFEGAKAYANPLISVSGGKFSDLDNFYHFERWLRIPDEKFVQAVLAFDAEGAAMEKRRRSVQKIPYGRFGGDYWGDFLMQKALAVPFAFGATVEETILNAIEYETKNAGRAAAEAVVQSGNVLNSLMGEDDDASVATDATSSADATSEAPAGGEVLSDDDGTIMDENDESDVDMAFYGSRVDRILKLYDSLYAGDPRNAFAYKYVAVLPKVDSPVMSLYVRNRATQNRPWNPEVPFGKINGATVYHVGETDYAAFCKAAKNLWKGLVSSYPCASSEAYGLRKALPKDANDFEWLDSVMSNGEPSVSWFPFIHAALMGHIAPWDFGKEKPKTHGWKELRGMLQKWFLAVFRALGAGLNNDERALDVLCEAFMRHFVVAGGNQTFTFSVYWDKKVRMDVPALSSYFKDADVSISDDTAAEMLNEVNTLVTCESSNVFEGVFMGGFTPNLKSYLGDTLLGYDVVLDYLKSHNNVLAPTEIPLGQSFRGRAVTINLNGGQSVFPAVIRAGARSGKGVLTQLLMITMLGCGKPFVYFDDKPDMSKTWVEWGRSHGVNTLAADIRSDYREFALGEAAEAINPCQFAVMMSSDYIGLLNFIYFGKMVGLLGGIVQARLKRGGEFPKSDTYVFIDEVNKMGGDLKSVSVPKNPVVGMKYAEARKNALAVYKKSNKDATLLPPDYDITVQGVGTYSVAQWDAVVGSDGKCTQLNKKLTDLIGALGKFVGSLSKDAPVAHVYGVLIGQTTPMSLTSMESSFGENVGKAFREASRMALFGRMWGDMESSTDELKDRLGKTTNSQLTDLTPGIFLYKKGASEGFTAIKTGVVLAENDALTVEYNPETGDWEGGDKDFAKMLLSNVKSSAGAEASETFKEEKLLVTPKMQKILADGGIGAEVGAPNPLVTFDGLLEYVANKTGNSPTEPVQILYNEFSKLLSVTGSGFTDAYTYLLDPSAIYVEDDFVTALVSGTSLIQGSADNAGQGSSLFGGVETGIGSETAGRAQEPYVAPIPNMPVNPARQEVAPEAAPTETPLQDASFGRPRPTFEDWAQRMQEKAAAANTEEVAEAAPEGFTDAGEDGETPDLLDAAAAMVSDEDYESTATMSADAMPEDHEVATPRTNERRTPAPPVCGTQGASSRYGGGPAPYAENSDGSITIEVPGGKVQGYYTAAETVQTLSRLFDDASARKLATTPKGREIMALQGMLKLVEMIEQKTGINRAMIKSVTFADNCLFVRDACVVGGKPDAYDLYDYIEIRNFLKAMSGITVLQMDRDAYFHLMIRPGYKAEDAFLFSPTLQTLMFDKCQILRDGRVIGEAYDSVKDSFISQFDAVVTDNSMPMSKSKLASGGFLASLRRIQEASHTPEYAAKRASIKKAQRDLYGARAEKYLSEDKPLQGFFSAIRYWWYDRRLAALQKRL